MAKVDAENMKSTYIFYGVIYTSCIQIIRKYSTCNRNDPILTQDSAFWKPFLNSKPLDFPMFFTYGKTKDSTAEPCKEVLHHKRMLMAELE